MPANKLNYIVLHEDESQVLGSASKQIALETPLPPNTPIEKRKVFFISYEPDNQVLVIHPLPDEEVIAADVKPSKTKKEDNV